MAVNSNLNTALTTVYDGLVMLEEKTASSSATLDFTGTISSNYDQYVVEFIDIVPASDDVALLMRMSTDGGSTYDSGANYAYANLVGFVSTVGEAGVNSGGTSITLVGDITTTANYVCSGTLKFYHPGSAKYKDVAGQFRSRVSAGDARHFNAISSGSYLSTTAVNAFRFLLSSGNIASGTIRTYGVSKSVGATLASSDANLNVYGRLTTESGVPVSTSDRTAQSTLYFTPYNGTSVPLFNGTRWVRRSFSEISLALSGLTSGKNYDVFVYDNAGVVTLELSAAWSSDTARTDAIALQNGVFVKSGTPTRLHLGTIRTTGTTTIEDSLAKRFVWNRYNQAERYMFTTDTTNSWTYSTATLRQANAAAANQLDYVVGDAAAFIKCEVSAFASSTATAGVETNVGIDSTTTGSAQIKGAAILTNAYLRVTAEYKGYPGLGRHTLVWLEAGGGTGTQTWFGDDGGPAVLARISAINGTLFN